MRTNIAMGWLITMAIVIYILAVCAFCAPSIMGMQEYIYTTDARGYPVYDSQKHEVRTPNPLWSDFHQASYKWSLFFVSISIACLLVVRFKNKQFRKQVM
jgi:hypothetical protein